MLQARWTEGVKALLQSYTTEMLISTQDHQFQIESVRQLLVSRKQILPAGDKAAADLNKAVDESLQRGAYVLSFLYAALTDEQELLSKVEVKTLIEKHLGNITEYQYGLVKLSLQGDSSIESVITRYEARGEEEKTQAAKLRKHIADLEAKIGHQAQQVPAQVEQPAQEQPAEDGAVPQSDAAQPVAVQQPAIEQPVGIPHLQSYEQYTAKYHQLQAAFESCDLEQVRALFAEIGIKYAPYTSAANQQLYIHGLMDLNEQEHFWPIFTALCRDGVAPVERKIELLEFLKTNGFNLRQALSQVRQPGKVSFKENAELPINLAVPLLVALHYQQWDLAHYLWTNEDFVNVYEPSNL